MPLHAIVALFGTELSKDLVTAASLMLSICKQDKIVQRIVMHQAACADFSMVLMPLVIVTAASSSTQLPQIFQLNPKIALVTSNLCRLTQVLQLSPQNNAHAALEKLIWSDLLKSAKIDPRNW
jgi:Na+-translocating ferredoxin:NAD+ oxidoreductase RnfA subunit